MAVCPICQSGIEISSQNYGTLYTCPSCSAVFFVDWNGNPEAASEENQYQQEGDLPPLPPMEPIDPIEPIEPMESMDPIEPIEPADFISPTNPLEPVTETEAMSSGFSEITDFGNADVEQAAFHYSVEISGIDSSAVYQQVKEALTDSKFAWDPAELMSKIKDGVLTIRSVNAVKTSILVQRVKYLPVKVSWRQDVLSSQV